MEKKMWQDFLARFPSSSLLRVVVFLLVWVIFWLPIAIPLAKFLQWNPHQPLSIGQKLSLMTPLYIIAPLLIWGIGQVEGVSFTEYGLSWTPQLFISLLLGFGLALGGLVIVFGVEGLLDWIQWHPENIKQLLTTSPPILVLGLWIGVTEELIFRGFFLNELRQDYPLAIAAAVSSGVFALLHLVWEQEKTLPQLPGLWVMAMVLVGARLVDHGSLGLAWGLHAGWIWGLSSLDAAGLMGYTGKGPAWMTGFGEQPLAGIAGIICLLLTGVMLLLLNGQ
jgi:membrane protease YdiL (CAAX protease family)